MSGGHFEYYNDRACNEIFNWEVTADYGLGSDEHYKASVKMARKQDPMEDKMLSELVFDVFCLLHSVDWYKSGDTCEETYRKDVRYFKEKWFGKTTQEIIEDEINKSIAQFREEMEKTLSWAKGPECT